MESKELAEIVTTPENSKRLATIWGDYIDWEGRRRGENGFLANQLRKHGLHRIVDVATGDGADSIYLIKEGFNVFTNELDDAFREKAVDNAGKQGVEIAPTKLDWRWLHEEYPQVSFDAVTCLGNSLTYIFNKGEQLKVLNEFHQLLRLGGILLIDERNYPKILENRNEYLTGKAGLTGPFMYTGRDVDAKCVEISDVALTAQLTHRKTGTRGYFRVYPFKKGELLQLLQETGFSSIEKFSDYEPGDNPDADFYQYVCIK